MYSRYIIIIFIVILSVFKYYHGTHNVSVVSSEGNKYYVNMGDSELKKEKAELLDKLKLDIKTLINTLKNSEHSKSKNVKRLINDWSGYIEELSELESKNIFAYNVNKGEQISVCLTNKKTGKLNEYNEIMYVVLHELAHVMTQDYSHNKEFWDNFAFLVKNAIRIGIYKKINYQKNPAEFCNATLTG